MSDRPTPGDVTGSALPPIPGPARALMALPWVVALGLLGLIAVAIATVFADTSLEVTFWVTVAGAAGAAVSGALSWVRFGPGAERITTGAVLGGLAVFSASVWVALTGR